MRKTRIFLRSAMALWAIAILFPIHTSFAQSPPDAAALMGKWELFSVDGRETTIPRATMEITAQTLEVLDNCNEQSYAYTIKNGEMTAAPPNGRTLMACSDKTMASNQASIITAITRSTVQLSGDSLQLTPLPRPSNGELEFLRKLEFRREK